MMHRIFHVCVLIFGQVATLCLQILILREMGVGGELAQLLIYIAPSQFFYTVLLTHFQYEVFSRINALPQQVDTYFFYENYVQKRYLFLFVEIILAFFLSSVYVYYTAGHLDFSLLFKTQLISLSIYYINILSLTFRHKKVGLFFDVTVAGFSLYALLLVYYFGPKISQELANLHLARYLPALLTLTCIFLLIKANHKNPQTVGSLNGFGKYNLRLLPMILITKGVVFFETTVIAVSIPEYISIYNILLICFAVFTTTFDKAFLLPSYVNNKSLYSEVKFIKSQILLLLSYLIPCSLLVLAVLVPFELLWIGAIMKYLNMSSEHSQLIFDCGLILIFVAVVSIISSPISQAYYVKKEGHRMQIIGVVVIIAMLPLYYVLIRQLGLLGVFCVMAIRYLLSTLVAYLNLLIMERNDGS